MRISERGFKSSSFLPFVSLKGKLRQESRNFKNPTLVPRLKHSGMTDKIGCSYRAASMTLAMNAALPRNRPSLSTVCTRLTISELSGVSIPSSRAMFATSPFM